MRKTQRKRRLKRKREQEHARQLQALERLLPIKAAMARGELRLQEATERARLERERDRYADHVMRAYARLNLDVVMN